MPAGPPLPQELLEIDPPWDRTDLDARRPAKAGGDAVRALEVALECLAEGWDMEYPVPESSGLPAEMREWPEGWMKPLAEAMPALGDITWDGIRAAAPKDLPDDRVPAVARLWAGRLVGDLVKVSGLVLEDAALDASLRERIGEALARHYPSVRPFYRSYLLPLLRHGGAAAIPYLARLENDPRLDADERWEMEQARRTLEGERMDLPEFVARGLRGRVLAQVRRAHYLHPGRPPRPDEPLELTFEDGGSLRVGVEGLGWLEFQQGPETLLEPAPEDGGTSYDFRHLYMKDVSDEPVAWEAIGRPVTAVRAHSASPEVHSSGMDVDFGEVRMAVRAVTGDDGHLTLDVTWTMAGAG